MPHDIFAEFKEHSVAEFFKKNRQMLGYSGAIKSLTTAVHEYVTNALDACEESGHAPEIYVELKRLGPDSYKLIAEDNGPGIPKKFIGGVFGKMLAGTKFHRFQQARGQQGIGGAGVVMFSQVTTGKPSKIISSLGDGKIFDCYVSIDVKTNEPMISDPKEYVGNMRGTRIESDLKGVKYQKGEYSVDEYLRRTALANPHVKITYIDPDNITTVYDRAIEKVPKLPKSTKPHPKGIEVDDLIGYASKTNARSIKTFLETDFTRISSAKAKELEDKCSFDFNKVPKSMSWEEAEQVVKAIKETTFIAPPTECLIPIGEKHLEKALENILKPEFKTILTRPAAIFRGGVPFIIEVALAFGGNAGKKSNNSNGYTAEDIGAKPEEHVEQQGSMEIMRFANRVPLLFDAGGCAITKAIQSVDLKRYKIREDIPVTILVNFTSIHVPYTGAGKESISEEDEVIKEIRLALMDTARRLGKYVSGQRRMYEKDRRLKEFLKYIPETAKAVAKLSGEKEKEIFDKLSKIVLEKYGEMEDEDEEDEELLDGENGEDNLKEVDE